MLKPLRAKTSYERMCRRETTLNLGVRREMNSSRIGEPSSFFQSSKGITQNQVDKSSKAAEKAESAKAPERRICS
jgi:hypothetical protein